MTSPTTSKPPLWDHQRQALRTLQRNNGGFLFMPMRTGKTRVATTFISRSASRGVRRVLIVAPLSALSVWRRELEGLREDVEIMLLNYERLYSRQRMGKRSWAMVDNLELMEFHPQLIVVDEAHRIGDPQTLASRKLYKLVKQDRPQVVLLTGTPLERGPLKTFGMAKLYDDTLFGTAYGSFKRTYAVYGGYGNFKLLRYRNLGRLRRKLAGPAFFMEHVPPRPPVDVYIKFPLQESKALYEEMAAEGFTTLQGGGSTVDTPNALVKHVRLAQIAGGAVKTDDQRLRRVGTEKASAFADWLTGAEGLTKLVVGCRFLFELRDATKSLQRAGYRVLLLHGGVPDSIRERRIAAFNETSERTAFVAQISTGKEGIDLSAADTLVWYSLTRSLVDYKQFGARIRKFKDPRALTYVFMLAEGTVDELNLLAFQRNMDVIDLITKHPEWMRYRGVA